MPGEGYFLTRETAEDLQRLIAASPGTGVGAQGRSWQSPIWEAVLITGGTSPTWTGQVRTYDGSTWTNRQTVSVKELNGGSLIAGKTYPALRVGANLLFAMSAGGSGAGECSTVACNVATIPATWELIFPGGIADGTCSSCGDIAASYELVHLSDLSWGYTDDDVVINFVINGPDSHPQAECSIELISCNVTVNYDMAGPTNPRYCSYPWVDGVAYPELSSDEAGTPDYHAVGLTAINTAFASHAGEQSLLWWQCFNGVSGYDNYAWAVIFDQDLIDLITDNPTGAVPRISGPFISDQHAYDWLHHSHMSTGIGTNFYAGFHIGPWGCFECPRVGRIDCCTGVELQRVVPVAECDMPTLIGLLPSGSIDVPLFPAVISGGTF